MLFRSLTEFFFRILTDLYKFFYSLLSYELTLNDGLLISRFIGNLDLCGRQVNKPCRTSLGFPAVLPHAESDQAAG